MAIRPFGGAGTGGAITVPQDLRFSGVDVAMCETSRDSFFTTNPTRKTSGVYVVIEPTGEDAVLQQWNGTVWQDMSTVVTGPQGVKGDKGDTGEGIQAGGTTGQVLLKNSNTDYDTTWADLTGGGDMLKATYDPDNDGLIAVAQISGLGTAATADTGTGATNVILGNDARLTDARTPTAHVHPSVTTSDDGFMSTTDKTKLDGVETGATANATDAQLRDRATHTGAQAISTITGLQSAHDGKVDKDGTKALSDENYTRAEKEKLGNLTDSFKGYFADATARDAVVTSPQIGNYCLQEDTDTVWYFNESNSWVNTRSTASGDMLAAIYDPTAKHTDVFLMSNMVEGADSKIMTGAERSKLSGIEDGATSNASDAQLRDRGTHTGTQAISTITGLDSALSLKADLVAGKVPSNQLPNSDAVTEGSSNLYFTAQRVRDVLLTGLSTATNAAIAATDSVLVAFGKAQAQFSAILASLNSHIGNTTNAHGMTTPGAAIVQAATVADQRAALGALSSASPASSGAWVHDGTAEIKGAAALRGNTALVASARLNIGLGALWKPGVQIGQSPYSGLYGSALTYLAAVESGGWVSTGGGTASALTVDEGYLSFATSEGVPSSGTALSWTTRLQIAPSGRTQIDGSLYLRDELRPVVDNNHSIGEATLRFATGYFATNPVIGSDSRLKTDIAEIPGAIATEIMRSLRPVTFRYKVGGQEAYEEDESFEERAPVTEPVEVPKTTVQIVDGKAVQVTTTETVQQPVYDEYLLVDGDGKPVIVDGVQAVHREPRMTTVTKTRKVTKYREVEGKRYHAGYIAQEVKAALDAVADRWQPAADLAVWLLSDTADADSTQMVRMEQMTPILHAAIAWQWQQK